MPDYERSVSRWDLDFLITNKDNTVAPYFYVMVREDELGQQGDCAILKRLTYVKISYVLYL